MTHSNCLGAKLLGGEPLGVVSARLVLGGELLGVLGAGLVLGLVGVRLLGGEPLGVLGAGLVLGLLGVRLLGGEPLGVVGAGLVLGLLGAGLPGGGPNPNQIFLPTGTRMNGALSLPAGSSRMGPETGDPLMCAAQT